MTRADALRAAPEKKTWFVPHGSRCEADDGRGGEFGKCSAAAYGHVIHNGSMRPVCHHHFTHYDGEKRWPEP